MAIDQRGVGQRPEMFSRLEFRGIGRQQEQMDMRRDAQMAGSVLPRPIQYEHDLFGRSSTNFPSELREFDLEQRDIDGGCQMEHRPPRGWVDEPDQIAPGIAVLHWRQGTPAVETPDFVQDRFQANAVFIHRPEFHLRLGKRGGYLAQQGPQLFLNASCAAASAWTWRGRGFRRFPSSRTR